MANQKIYYAPIIIHGKADLDNYNIQWSDCRTLHFGTSGSVTIYPFPTESKELYNLFRKELNNQHSDAYRATRCQVPGKRGRLVRCDTRNSCANCPFGIDPANKEPNSVSLDGLVEVGWEPNEGDRTYEKALAAVEYADIRARMDAEDDRIAPIFEDYTLAGLSIAELMVKYSLSRRRVFQLLARARAIGQET